MFFYAPNKLETSIPGFESSHHTFSDRRVGHLSIIRPTHDSFEPRKQKYKNANNLK
jgi:hypothetical protein